MIACYAILDPGDRRASMTWISADVVDRWLDGIANDFGWPSTSYGAVPCVVNWRAGDHVYLIVDRQLAASAEVFGDRFFISSARGFDAALADNIAAALADNIAAAWRPGGVP